MMAHLVAHLLMVSIAWFEMVPCLGFHLEGRCTCSGDDMV